MTAQPVKGTYKSMGTNEKYVCRTTDVGCS